MSGQQHRMLYSDSGIRAQEYELNTDGLSDLHFGQSIRGEFGLMPEVTFLNHGSYGTVPKRVLELQHRYNQERERHPDAWFRLNAPVYLDKTRQEVATLINACTDNVVLVENATTAVNCVMRAFPFKSGDAFLDNTLTYGAVQNLSLDLASRMRPDIERVHVTLTLPIHSEDDVIAVFTEALKKHPNIRLAIIDHITSPTSIVMPVARLCQLCHAHKVTVLVDGAHAFGQLPLDMEEIGADVYTSNFHKWGFSPRGVAMLYFSEKSRNWVRPPNTSWRMDDALEFQFFDQGTRDHVPGICARHGIQFLEALGGREKVVNYTSQLANDGRQLLLDLGLETLPVPPAMEAPNMKMIKLPPLSKYPYDVANLWLLHRDLFAGTNIFCLVVPYAGSFWVRLCAQVYNDREDMRRIAQLVRTFIDKSKISDQ